ncbi:hypothetical protein QC758_19510 [Halomonas campisalis]|nr:hypothetical protein [Halomonas campisalis]MDR5865143.1 hypothetical protein [Halomonas campisalis]
MKGNSRNAINLRKTMTVLCLVAASPVSLAAGPFGLEQGMKKEEIGGLEATENPLMYRATEVPVPSQHFERYSVMVGEEAGLCAVRAVTGPIETNRYGHELKNYFENLKGALTDRYGEGVSYDFLMPGSIWDESRDFMMGMVRGDRKLTSFWKGEDESLPHDLKAIMLDVNGQVK